MDRHLHSARVTIVDDDPAIAALLSHLLRLEGFRTEARSNAPLALTELLLDPPDVAILDILMPGIDGLELARSLSNNPQTQHVQVIFVTAMDSSEHRRLAAEAGANAYITKPFEREDVVAAVRHALAGEATQQV